MIKEYKTKFGIVAIRTEHVTHVKLPNDEDGKCYAQMVNGAYINLTKEQGEDLIQEMKVECHIKK